MNATAVQHVALDAVECTAYVLSQMDAESPATPYSELPREYERRLRACVQEMVVGLRRNGATPEEALAAARSLFTSRFAPEAVYSSRLVSDVVLWALKAYYDD